MQTQSDVNPMPVNRKTTMLTSPPHKESVTSLAVSYDDDATSCSATGRKFLRRQRSEMIVSKIGDKPKTENSGMQFVTVKKLQQIRNNALSPEPHKFLCNIQQQVQCPETLNSLPKSHLERMRSQSPLISSYIQKNLQKCTSPTQPLYVQTSGLTFPVAHGENKVVDCRTRPGTPYKDEIKIPHTNDITKNFNPVAAIKETRVAREDQRIKLLETRISQLQVQLSQSESYRGKCDELEAKLNRESSLSSNNVEKISKLFQESERKQLEIVLLREELTNFNSIKQVAPVLKHLRSATNLTTKKITESSQYQETDSNNKRLQQQIQFLKNTVKSLEIENAKLKKTNKCLTDQIAEQERTRKHKLNEEIAKGQSQKQIQLEQQIRLLKEQLQLALNVQNSDVINQLTYVQQQLMIVKKELNYHHILNYCVKRQLQECKNELAHSVSQVEHNDLKTKFKKLSVRHRELATKSRYEEEFELTPEKPRKDGVTALY